jgi:hypothetical protein
MPKVIDKLQPKQPKIEESNDGFSSLHLKLQSTSSREKHAT